MELITEPKEPTYVARPLKRISRKRYAEAVRCLKGAIANPKLSWTRRLRAVELLMVLYGVEMPEPITRRDRRSLKSLVVENSFDRQVRARVQEGVLSETARKAKEEAERYLAKQASEEAEAEREKQERFDNVWAQVTRGGGDRAA